MKSEPEVFSIHDLAKAPKKTTFWDGVRNYQARNLLRDELKPGDGVLYYHSNADPPGVAGTATVAGPARPDETQFDASDADHYDAASTREAPRWYGVDVTFESAFPRFVSLDEIKTVPALADMVLVKRSRLSVQPVTEPEWKTILKLGSKAR